MTEIVEGLLFKRIYWVRGKTPKGAILMNDVTDPPCSGWQGAFIISGEKRSTIFCPFSMKSYRVSNTALEIAGAIEPWYGIGEEPHSAKWWGERILEKWAFAQQQGWQSDYDVAAIVLKKLGAEVPTITLDKDGEEDTKSRGGKPVGAKLLKVVKSKTKRGKILAWILADENARRSVREAMGEFDMKRSSILSQFYMFHKDHGIGYDLVGDAVTVTLPEGCTWPFDTEEIFTSPLRGDELRSVTEQMEEDDDSWLD